jgi:hypothetical protein
MTEVRTIHGLEKIRVEFDLLLENLATVLKETRPRTNILSTKLGRIKKDLLDITKLNNESLAMIAEITTKYNSINNIFTSNIEYNKKDLAKIIEGKSDYLQDSNEGYNDIFFELSMGVRFLLSESTKKAKINLSGICDVVIDDKIAIECKYIHSVANISKNIKKADDQIKQRISDKQATCGFIALDLSNVCPRDKIKEYADYTFEKFIENYKAPNILNHTKTNPLRSVLSDKNFSNIIGSYIMHEIEILFLSEDNSRYVMSNSALAILVQTSNAFCFEHEGEVAPLSTRGMTYFMNPSINYARALEVNKLIHSLAVGV